MIIKNIIYLDASNLYGVIYKFLPTSVFKWIDPKEFYLNKYTSNNSKGCLLEVDLQYSEELCQLHYDHLVAPDKVKIKKEMLSIYQTRIAYF